MIRSIAHPTDFSPESEQAFEHALRLALITRAQLFILHVRRPGEREDWRSFPGVREVLQRWGILTPGAEVAEVFAKTGVKVTKAEIVDAAAGDGLARFVETHRPDLVVMASRGNAGISRWFSGSVAAEVVRETLVPTLVFGPAARPFVNSRTGEWNLKSILVPVDREPAPDRAVDQLHLLTEGLGIDLDFLHVGTHAPLFRDADGTERPVRTIDGPVVETILEEASYAGLIAMPTAGRDGFWDTIRGSTTERVVSEVSCPVLALPMAD